MSSPLPTPARCRGGAVGLGLAVLVLLAAGCGGADKGQPIPAASATKLIALLDQADRRVAGHACNQVKRRTLPQIDERLKALPANTDRGVRSTLDDGVNHLRDLVDSQCRPRAKRRPTTTTTPTQTQTQTQPTQTQRTQTQPTQTQRTQTQPPPTTSTTPPPTTKTTPPKKPSKPPPTTGGQTGRGGGSGKGDKKKAQGATAPQSTGGETP